jgi:hypothetical protein
MLKINRMMITRENTETNVMPGLNLRPATIPRHSGTQILRKGISLWSTFSSFETVKCRKYIWKIEERGREVKEGGVRSQE